MSKKIIITAALSGATTVKEHNPAVPYTAEEFAAEAARCYKAGAAMVHVHARLDDGTPTHEIGKIRATHDAIKEKTPELIVNISSAVGRGKTPEQRIAPIVAIKPEMASLNTNSMNFASIHWKTGEILNDYLFDNTFFMLQDFSKAMEENGTKPEIEVYDMGGLDNVKLVMKQGMFSNPMNFNFVMGVHGGAHFRPDLFAALVNALPPGANFTGCGVGKDEFPTIMQSALMGGHMRVGLEDNVKLPNGELAKGSYELVACAVKIAEVLGLELATPDEAREIMGISKR
ncbi:MAG: 3-keto-5-aminohexanoate cleavage protein [Pseudomonadota bacterium]